MGPFDVDYLLIEYTENVLYHYLDMRFGSYRTAPLPITTFQRGRLKSDYKVTHHSDSRF